MSKVIFATPYHKRSLFYEEAMRQYKDFKLFIQITGDTKHFGSIGLPCYYLESHHIPYDESMVRFQHWLSMHDWDTVVFIDNDCFPKDRKYLESLISEFEGRFDFACYFVNPSMYEGDYSKLITPVEKVTFNASEEYPYFAPIPHFENALLLMSRKAFLSLTSDEVSHGRKLQKAVFEKGLKMGVFKVDYHHTYTHYNSHFLHIGNLMAFYQKLEKGDTNWNVDSVIEMSRLGYFYAQQKIFGKGIYSDYINSILEEIGNREKALQSFEEITKGSPYECFL